MRVTEIFLFNSYVHTSNYSFKTVCILLRRGRQSLLSIVTHLVEVFSQSICGGWCSSICGTWTGTGTPGRPAWLLWPPRWWSRAESGTAQPVSPPGALPSCKCCWGPWPVDCPPPCLYNVREEEEEWFLSSIITMESSHGLVCHSGNSAIISWRRFFFGSSARQLYPPHLSHATMCFLNQHVGDNSIVSQRNPASDVRLANWDFVIGLRSEELCGPQRVGSHVVGWLFTVDFDAA